jgi:hypothetical protein
MLARYLIKSKQSGVSLRYHKDSSGLEVVGWGREPVPLAMGMQRAHLLLILV